MGSVSMVKADKGPNLTLVNADFVRSLQQKKESRDETSSNACFVASRHLAIDTAEARSGRLPSVFYVTEVLMPCGDFLFFT